MKLITYKYEDVARICGYLNKLQVEGIGQARQLAAAGNLLDSPQKIEDVPDESPAEKEEKQDGNAQEVIHTN